MLYTSVFVIYSVSTWNERPLTLQKIKFCHLYIVLSSYSKENKIFNT